MTQPTNYTPTTDFSQQEAINASGRSTVNTAALDAEFANIETTLDQAVSNLSLIQRDDGRLKDVSVEIHTISPEVLNLIGGGYALRGLWAEATVYALNDICSNGAYTYVCRTAHTASGLFDGKYWTQFGFTSGADAAQAAAAAQGSATSAAGSATAAGNSAIAASGSATSASSSATAANGSAITAVTKAAESSASATQAAASAAQSAAAAIPSQAGRSGPMVTNGAVASWLDSAMGVRSKLLNGGFNINQRAYVSGTAVGSGLYGHDRWKMAALGDTYAFSTTENVTTVTIPAGKVLRQVIEGVNLQSGTYVLSWSGTAQGKIGAGNLSASGVTGSAVGGADLTIEFGPGTVSKIQLEEGSVATPFVNRPYGLELAQCQRYFEVCHTDYALLLSPRAGTAFSTSSQGEYAFKVTKRVVPTISGAVFSNASSTTTESTLDFVRFIGTATGSSPSVLVGWTANSEL